MRIVSLSLALVPALLTAQRGGTNPASTAPASPPDVIAKLAPKEWTAPWPATDRSRDAFPDGKGNIWYVAQVGDYVANVNITTGEFKKYAIDPGSKPHNLVVHNGIVWFTGNANNRIVKLDPATGKLTTYMIPDTTVRDPHTMIFDAKGDAWFTAQNSQFVGRFTPSTGAFKLWKLPRTNPYGIVLSSRGQPYFDMFATNKIGTIDPATLEVKE